MSLNFFVQASLHTPLWVYAILLYLMYVGCMFVQTRVVHIGRLAIVPLLLFILSVHNLSVALTFTLYTISAWLLAMLFGMFLGVLQIRCLEIAVDRKHRFIKAPGTWSVIVIILVVFCTKYYFGYELSVDPKRLHDTNFELAALTISGLCSGFSLGRLFGFLYRLLKDPEVELNL